MGSEEQKPPKVSVIVSTYNRVRMLERALRSVQRQTFKDFECIVVDDRSEDKTPQLVEKLGLEDPRFRYIRMGEHFGKDTRPKNLCIVVSKGEYIAYLDDDNEFTDNHLEVLLTEIELSGVDVVYGDMMVFDSRKRDKDPMPGIAMDFDEQFLMRRCFIDTSMVLHKRDAVFRVGGWDETLPRFVDWNLWVRMTKAGCSFKHVPVFLTKYFVGHKNSASAHPVKSWVDQATGLTMFQPTFDPTGCPIYLPYLGNDREEEKNPRVAIFTITYERLEYTQRMIHHLRKSTEVPFDWFVFDNGSKDGTADWLKEKARVGEVKSVTLSLENVGISKASNALIEEIQKRGGYQIIVKMDNDCQCMTAGWLENFGELWKRNHMLYLSPYPEGLVHNPGGAPRIGAAFIGDEYVEVTMHIGGFCAFIDARAYQTFRWADKFLHGNQDVEASQAFRKLRYMPAYVPRHRVWHMDGTTGQHNRYPDYFERRRQEKQTQVAV